MTSTLVRGILRLFFYVLRMSDVEAAAINGNGLQVVEMHSSLPAGISPPVAKVEVWQHRGAAVVAGALGICVWGRAQVGQAWGRLGGRAGLGMPNGRGGASFARGFQIGGSIAARPSCSLGMIPRNFTKECWLVWIRTRGSEGASRKRRAAQSPEHRCIVRVCVCQLCSVLCVCLSVSRVGRIQACLYWTVWLPRALETEASTVPFKKNPRG